MKAIRMSKLLKGELTKQIIGAFPQVHYELGAGFLESVSANAMEIALCGPGLQVEREVPLVVCFRRHGVGSPAHQQPPRQSARGRSIAVFGPRPVVRRKSFTNGRELLRQNAYP